MAIGDVYQLQLHYSYSGQRLMNTLAFRMETAPDPVEATFAALATDWKDIFVTQQSTGVTYISWLAQQVRGGTVSYTDHPCQRTGGRRLEGLFTGSLVGTGSGDGLPPQCAWVTTLYTGFSGRTKRGRFYLGGLPESLQAGGTWNSASVTSYQTQWGTQLAQYGTSGTDPNFRLGVWSMRIATGCAVRTTPPYGLAPVDSPDESTAFAYVTSATVRSTVFSQRKRTIGVGT